MANISLDFSTNSIFKKDSQKLENLKDFTYRDMDLDKFLCKKNNIDDSITVNTISNFKTDMNAIKNSIVNILNFKKGESILEPEFGISDIYEMLYTPFDKYTTEKMIKTMIRIITMWEPRIEIISIPTEYDEDKQEFHMTINYFIPSLNRNDSLEYFISK